MSITTPKPLTGRKVLVITLLAFGTIISANLSLIYFAFGSFPGLEVKNTYVASQKFEAAKAAQDALGWTVQTNYGNGILSLSFTNADNAQVIVSQLQTSIGRATHAGADQQVFFTSTPNGYQAPVHLNAGNWQLRISALAQGGTRFWQHIPLNVSN